VFQKFARFLRETLTDANLLMKSQEKLNSAQLAHAGLLKEELQLQARIATLEARVADIKTRDKGNTGLEKTAQASPFPEIDKKLLSRPVAPKYALLLIFLLFIFVVE